MPSLFNNGYISLPRGIKAAMRMQVEEEHKRRAWVLESEGEAEATRARVEATAEGNDLVSKAGKAHGGDLATVREIAKGTIPSNPATMTAQAFSTYKQMKWISPRMGPLDAKIKSLYKTA